MNLVAHRLFVVGLAVVVAGCHGPPPKGEAAFTFVTAPTGPEAKGDAEMALPPPGTEFTVPAEPIPPLSAPVYPSSALGKMHDRVTVGVRLTVDPNGRVSSVGSSLHTFSSPNGYGRGFREAVEAAVAQWRFEPARFERAERVKTDHGEVLAMTETGKTDWDFDVTFTFTASGEVTSGVPGLAERSPASTWTQVRKFFVRLFPRRVLRNESP